MKKTTAYTLLIALTITSSLFSSSDDANLTPELMMSSRGNAATQELEDILRCDDSLSQAHSRVKCNSE